MNCDYDDIRSRIAEPPAWWDEYAVPRYGEFRPGVDGCKRCGRSKHPVQVFCGAACSAKWEGGDRG